MRRTYPSDTLKGNCQFERNDMFLQAACLLRCYVSFGDSQNDIILWGWAICLGAIGLSAFMHHELAFLRPTQASEDLTHDLLGSWTWQTRTQTSSLAILETILKPATWKKTQINIPHFHISCIHFSYHQPHLTHPFSQPTTDTKVVWLTTKPSMVREPDLIRSSMIFVCPSCSFLREAIKHFSLGRFFLGGEEKFQISLEVWDIYVYIYIFCHLYRRYIFMKYEWAFEMR